MSESKTVKTAIGKADSRCRGALFCKIQVHGRRESFLLLTTDKSAAASKVAKIYADISVLGWQAAITKHKPVAKKVLESATVGTLIKAASRLSSPRRESLDAAHSANLDEAEFKSAATAAKSSHRAFRAPSQIVL